MVESRTAISIEEAIRRVMESESACMTEQVDLTESHGRFFGGECDC